MKKPILIARGLVVFPNVELKIEIGRENSLKAVDLAMKNEDKEIIIVAQKDPQVEQPKFDDILDVGTLCKIKSLEKINDSEYVITVQGVSRVSLTLEESKKLFADLEVEFQLLPENNQHDAEDLENIKDYIEFLLENNIDADSEVLTGVINELKKDTIPNISVIIDLLGYAANKNNFNALTKLIQNVDIKSRLEVIAEEIFKKVPNEDKKNEVDSIVNKKLNENLSKQQKEFYLRERLRIVKEELGEISNRDDETEIIKKKVKKNPYPKHIKEKILQELSKYETAVNSNEAGIIKSYIDWLVDLPWWQESADNFDLQNVENVLNKNHYGIPKIKERILEYIAIKSNNKKSKSPIICLVGPPGVGKTSLAMSIAEALNKKYVKVSLGGIKDESEIRGHRKTYLGAMPGRIIKGMKKAGVINPLFLLDEIDKMGSDYKGDPASAMLEVLDPEQNKRFSDNYIEEEYDLSDVMFIATANYYDQIPYALLDRLEVIELSSYTANEKKEIAKNHLIKRVLADANLKQKDLKFSDEAIDHIINYYTREAGVRELERMIQKVVRKVLVLKLKKEPYPTVITAEDVEKFLGKKRFDLTLKEKNAIPGIVNGMAYTAAGGDLLPIEATFFKGKGDLIITGNLEKTMNESVSVALGYVKANAEYFGVDQTLLKNNDIHIHVPAGGIPKDGPSAGVALTTAIISAFRNEPVKTTISMTGEITLRGKVGIIGGVKEKIISAYRAGVREIFLPKDDERFLEDIPNYILKDIKINLVEKYEEIFNSIFKKPKSNLDPESKMPKKVMKKVDKSTITY